MIAAIVAICYFGYKEVSHNSSLVKYEGISSLPAQEVADISLDRNATDSSITKLSQDGDTITIKYNIMTHTNWPDLIKVGTRSQDTNYQLCLLAITLVGVAATIAVLNHKQNKVKTEGVKTP